MTIRMKATEHYFPNVLFPMLYKVVISFECMDVTLKCDLLLWTSMILVSMAVPNLPLASVTACYIFLYLHFCSLLDFLSAVMASPYLWSIQSQNVKTKKKRNLTLKNMEGRGFESYGGLRFFLCPLMVDSLHLPLFSLQ